MNSSTTPDEPPGLFKRPFTRRKVLTGLGGLAAVGIVGGMSWLTLFQKPQKLSSGQTVISSSTPRRGSPAVHTSPTNNPLVVPAHHDTPIPVASSAPVPTPTPTPTAISQPSPTPVPKLTLQMVSPPNDVTNNSTVIVNVTANEPGVTAILHVSYNVPPNIYDSGMQVTDSQGNAALVWQVQVSKLKHGHTTATVTVSGVDQSGQQAQSASISVNILPGNQNKKHIL